VQDKICRLKVNFLPLTMNHCDQVRQRCLPLCFPSNQSLQVPPLLRHQWRLAVALAVAQLVRMVPAVAVAPSELVRMLPAPARLSTRWRQRPRRRQRWRRRLLTVVVPMGRTPAPLLLLALAACENARSNPIEGGFLIFGG
jgi:hypothetical protein